MAGEPPANPVPPGGQSIHVDAGPATANQDSPTHGTSVSEGPLSRASDDTAVPGSIETLRFRRVFAPAGSPKDWPLDPERYTPIDKSEFERLLEAARTRSHAPAVERKQAISAARYSARLAGDTLVEGRVVFDVRMTTPGLMALEPCRLAISEAIWLGEKPYAAKTSLSADGKFTVAADRPGHLQLAWSFRGRKGPGEAVEFACELPECPVNELTLRLPKNLSPLVEHAILVPDATSDAQDTVWNIHLGSQNRFVLRIVSSELLVGGQKRATVRQAETYHLEPRGLELTSQWTLNAADVPLEQIALEMDPSLRLLSARLGQSPVDWSILEPQSEGHKQRVVLRLAEPIRGPGKVLRLKSAAPLQLSKPWRLPGVRPVDLFWQEGTATVLVASPLSLDRRTVVGGRQTQSAPLPAPQSGESAEFQCYGPEAAIEIALTRPEPRMEADCGSSLELSRVDMAAEVTGAFRVAEGERFQIEANVAPRWTIDSVDTIPPDALEDWSVQQAKSAQSRLQIRLAKAVSPARPVRVIVTGRYHFSPIGRVLSTSDLLPIEFRGVQLGKHLVAIRAAESCRLKLSGAEQLTRADPQGLTPAELGLFDNSSHGLLFVDDAQAASLRVAIEPQSPNYAATVHVEAMATEAGLIESYQIRCVPQSVRVDRVDVQFSQARKVPLRWTIGDEEDQVTIRRDNRNASAVDASKNLGESYTLTFRRPRSVPFEIRATRTIPWTGPVSVALASLREAASQRGTLFVGATGASSLAVESRHLTPIPLEPAPPGQYNNIQAAYRYQPKRDVGPGSQSAAIVSLARSAAGPCAAWAWNCHVESQFAPGAAAQHRITYRIENLGKDRITLALPNGLATEAIRGIWVDGKKAEWKIVSPSGQDRLAVELPAGRRFPVLVVCLGMPRPAMGLWESMRPPLVEIDVPVLRSVWTAWLPPGYQPLSPAPTDAWHTVPTKTCSQRLFGPLGRAVGLTRFRPQASEEWTQAAVGLFSPSRAERETEQFIERLGTLAGASSPSGTAADAAAVKTVGLAEQLAKAASDSDLTVLVDRVAFSHAGITHQGPVATTSDMPPADRGRRVLEQAGIALLISNDSLVLTTAVEAALEQSSLDASGPAGVWRVRPGCLAVRIATAADKGDDPFLVPVDAWTGAADDCHIPWAEDDGASRAAAATLGWSAYRLELPVNEAVKLVAVRANTLDALGWGILLGTLALLIWKARYKWSLLGGLAILWAATALLVPDVFSPLCSGGLLGTLAALVWGWITRARPKPPEEPGSTVRMQAPTLSGDLLRVGIVVIGLATGFGRPSIALSAEPDATRHNSPGATYQVLVPVDDKQQPAGDKYFVPEGLFSRLQAIVSHRADDSGWRLKSAVYRGALSWESGPEQLTLGDLRATFDLEVAGRSVTVRLPVGREGVELLADSVSLEGRPIQPTWPDAGGCLAFDVMEPGTYRLEFSVRPTAKASDGRSSLRWKIPPLCTSRLELDVPDTGQDVEFPTALGTITRQADPPRFVVALGSTDQLQVQWANRPSPERQGAGLEVEQYLGLRIQPGAVVLDCLWNVKDVAGQARQLEVAADPCLQLLPMQGDRSTTVQVAGRTGDFQRLRLESSRPLADRVSLGVSFLLRESSGVGNYRLPFVEPLHARITKRWLAVWVDPALQYTQIGAERLQAVAVPSFLTAWGEAAKSQPLFAWELPTARPEWAIATHSLPSRVRAEQTLSVTVGERAARILLEANVLDPGTAVFEYRVTAPPELDVERVSLVEGAVERVTRWSRAADGSITLLLGGATAGRQRLVLRGSIAAPEEGKMPLPLVRLDALSSRPMEIHVYRESAAQVQVANLGGLEESESLNVDESRGSLGRLVKSFKSQAGGPIRATLNIKANRPRIRAEQITRLRSQADAWEADVDFRFQVSGGLVDQFSFDIPPQWCGPFKVNPPAAIQLIEMSGRTGRKLVVRPRSAVEGDYHLSVSGPLTLAAEEPPAAVQVTAEDVTLGKHVLVLPTGPAISTAGWEMRGLWPVEVPKDLPEDLQGVAGERGTLVAYQVVGESYQAVLRSPEQAAGTLQAPFADVRLSWQTDGACHGVSAFDLEPAGLTTCPLVLPAGFRLVRVFVNGERASVTPMAPDRWQVLLASARLVQHIEVLFAGQLPQESGPLWRVFPTVTLGEIPIRQVVWSISSPPDCSASPGQQQETLTPLQNALMELRALAAAVQRAGELPGEELDDLTRWYRRWARRWAAARREMSHQLVLASSGEASTVREEVETLDKRQASIAERLGLGETASRSLSEPRRSEDAAEVWLADSETRPVIRVKTAGTITSLGLQYQRLRPSQLRSRWLSLLGLVAFSLGWVLGIRRGIFATAYRRWPCIAGILLGAAWWWWLDPSILGWLVMVLSLAAGLWTEWRRWRTATAERVAVQ